MSADFAGSGRRPKPRARVVIDPHNAYTRLGVSPLTPTDDIARILRDRRSALIREARARGDAGDETAAIAELQQIEDEIGTARARAAYDLLHPQNELLTVQPGAADALLDPRHRADLVTAWLLEELGPDAALPHPAVPALWLPDDDLLRALEPFETAAGEERAGPAGLSLDDLADAGTGSLALKGTT